MNFIVTFPQKPDWKRDGYFKIHNMESAQEAKECADSIFGETGYSAIYTEDDFESVPDGYFPHGCLAVCIPVP